MNESTRAVIARYVDARTPDASRQTAAWRAIEERLAAGDQGPGLVDEPVAGGGKAAAVVKVVVVGLIVAAGVVGAGRLLGAPDPDSAPAGVERAPDPEPLDGLVVKPSAASPVTPKTDPPKQPVVDVDRVPDEPAESSRESEDDDAPRIRRGRAGASSRGASRAPAKDRAAQEDDGAVDAQDSSSLAEEMKLLARGQRALKRGDAAAALRAFDEHARRYPNGALVDERRVQRAQTLCTLGRTDEARRAAAAFIRDAPGSPHVGKASRICQEDAQ